MKGIPLREPQRRRNGDRQTHGLLGSRVSLQSVIPGCAVHVMGGNIGKTGR